MKLIPKCQDASTTLGFDLKGWMLNNLNHDDLYRLQAAGFDADKLNAYIQENGEDGTLKMIKSLGNKAPEKAHSELGVLTTEKTGDPIYQMSSSPNAKVMDVVFRPSDDPETEWSSTELPGRYVSSNGEIADVVDDIDARDTRYIDPRITLGYNDDKWYNFISNAYDAAVRASNEHYQDPILGSLARWQESWHNDTNPVKAVLHNSPLAMTPQGIAVNATTELLGDDGVKKTGRLLDYAETLPEGLRLDFYASKVVPSMAGDALSASIVGVPAAVTTASLTKEGLDKLLYSPVFERVLLKAYGDEKAWEISEKIKAVGMAKYYRDHPEFAEILDKFLMDPKIKLLAFSAAVEEAYPMKLRSENRDAYNRLMELKRNDPEEYAKIIKELEKNYLISGAHARNKTTGSHVDVGGSGETGTIHVNLFPGNGDNAGIVVDPILLAYAKNMVQRSPTGTMVNGTDIPVLGWDLAGIHPLNYSNSRDLDNYVKNALNRSNYGDLTMSSVDVTLKTGAYPGFTITYPAQLAGFNSLNAKVMAGGSLYSTLRPQILKDLAARDRGLSDLLKKANIDVNGDPKLVEERILSGIAYLKKLDEKARSGQILTELEDYWGDLMYTILQSISEYQNQYWSKEFRDLLRSDKHFGAKGTNFPVIELGNGDYTVKSPTAVHIGPKDASPSAAFLELMGVPKVDNTLLGKIYRDIGGLVDWHKNGGKLISKNKK